jgi:uncharacterized cupredoxin-like copper-binding protein
MLYLALILGAGLALLSACGAATSKTNQMNISMTEFSYTPNVIEAKVGQQMTLHLMNTGALQHEIVFGRNMMMENSHPNGYEMDMFSMAGMEPVTFSGMDQMQSGMDMGQSGMQHGGYSVILPLGAETADITFTVTQDMVGEWEFGCFEQDGVHYTAGMTGKLVVTP